MDKNYLNKIFAQIMSEANGYIQQMQSCRENFMTWADNTEKKFQILQNGGNVDGPIVPKTPAACIIRTRNLAKIVEDLEQFVTEDSVVEKQKRQKGGRNKLKTSTSPQRTSKRLRSNSSLRMSNETSVREKTSKNSVSINIEDENRNSPSAHVQKTFIQEDISGGSTRNGKRRKVAKSSDFVNKDDHMIRVSANAQKNLLLHQLDIDVPPNENIKQTTEKVDRGSLVELRSKRFSAVRRSLNFVSEVVYDKENIKISEKNEVENKVSLQNSCGNVSDVKNRASTRSTTTRESSHENENSEKQSCQGKMVEINAVNGEQNISPLQIQNAENVSLKTLTVVLEKIDQNALRVSNIFPNNITCTNFLTSKLFETAMETGNQIENSPDEQDLTKQQDFEITVKDTVKKNVDGNFIDISKSAVTTGKNDEKRMNMLQNREALEKDKLEILQRIGKEKDEKVKHILEERDAKLKEEAKKKKQQTLIKVPEAECRRLEEEKRLIKFKKEELHQALHKKENKENLKRLAEEKEITSQQSEKTGESRRNYNVDDPDKNLVLHDLNATFVISKTESEPFTFYKLDELSSGESDDDNYMRYKPRAPWAKKHLLIEDCRVQEEISYDVVENFFGFKAHVPDVVELFGRLRPLHRTSSAVWNTPPRYSQLPKY